jgi:hypothetical protein
MSWPKYQSHEQKYTADNHALNDLSNQGYYLALKQKLNTTDINNIGNLHF